MNKHYLIAGGSSGIGRALVLKLAEAGHHVTVLSRNRNDLPEEIAHFTVDFESEQYELPVLNSSINGLVYMPGSIQLKPFKSIKSEEYLKDFRLNVLGAINCIRHFLPNMNSEGASIVLMSSVVVETGMPYHSLVGASKGAVEGLCRSLAAELAPRIRVNVIAPSLTDTPLAEKFLNSEEKRQASIERHPLKRVGNAHEIADMAAFLLSDSSAFMTAQIVRMDGGMSGVRKI
jgi:NAD(P)-dependent dehydrogenase (short-subunit alcohol dehydrogenase family)